MVRGKKEKKMFDEEKKTSKAGEKVKIQILR